ncbi:MAG: single-stranded-DNA-specific exonuclease RecJ [Atopobiaceae bacterium]|jgi:single-stranded-DNA-specific exonuclease|nr:single-stranded-DNA-specific exonuclease RecJ [Atopobiaceae bacterium]MCH4119563.1 single-stranded-DNA-specific exonuclease RecJ [Atopobiaceae bacterium]MCI1317944.1 single-stranded-DNA-specific exonuclease RecJ [Atopobiaceae bacterium]MCI1389552.1 single-stranded-DNA-specific exonuclease RecJ [Atopobiaceae bacterium]MCI1431616.1 single-stranded-DNA-specific exonuclease RecJ [Atopobiaceae bacterium]
MSGLYDSRRWDVLPGDHEAEERLIDETGIPPLAARVLVARGMRDPEEVRRFLTPSLERDWADPLLIPGLAEAAERVERAIKDGETIAIFGDFDVDGMSSTALLTLALRHLGANVSPYIPNRFEEGYGLSVAALERVTEDCHPGLIVTVDNGIASGKEVASLLEQGIDVVVTDHHEPGELVPAGVPVADPKLDPTCPSQELAGAGVALKLVCKLGRDLGDEDLWRRFTDIAALGTISDMMQLTGENRALVADGVARMRHSARPGFVALAAAAGVDLAGLTSDQLPFSLIPRLNAAGRMGESDVAFDLLLADDAVQAAELAGRLESINAHRREIEGELAEEAMALAEATYEGGHVVIVAGEGWHEGVKGIVASRLVSRFHVPVLLFSVSEGIARGSGRSVSDIDLFHVVEQCSDLLIRFGGHPGAVGVTIDAANLDAFRERMEEILSAYPPEDFEQRGEVAAVVSLDEVSMGSIASLDVLQPFGQGNKKPLLAATGVSMRDRSRVGASGDHLRFTASNGTSSLPAIMFRVPDVERAASCEGAVDLVFEPTIETWQGRSKAKLMVRDIIYRALPTPPAPDPDVSLADALFEQVPEILARGEYAGIAEAQSFVTKVVGVSFEGRQAVAATLAPDELLVVRREMDNPQDPNAIALVRGMGERVGYLRRQIARVLAPVMDAGAHYVARVIEVTGGTDDKPNIGVNVRIERMGGSGKAESLDLSACRGERQRLAGLPMGELTDEIRRRLIGENELLPAQAAALEVLREGRSCLCVMATGRGKSLIFHIHAAREAIAHGKASVFVYPLRALVADQAFHLEESLMRIGVGVRVLTGESSPDEREAALCALRSGEADVLLTTPEFLAIHADAFAESGRVGFVVVDEAHHAGAAKSGSRGAYLSLPEVCARLGNPACLGVTATATDEVAREACRLLGVAPDDVIVDDSCRENLRIVDGRSMRDRDAALVSLVSGGEKCVAYVNSREQSVMIARMLRRSLPDMGQRIAFYNAGLTRSMRRRVEEAFRSGELSCIVSTSAFGEGVNLPDIRHVVLYHMPFGAVEFNQMSGRAGRDGKEASIHLMFGARDARINERILEGAAPSRDDLVTLYRTLMSLCRRHAAETGEDSFAVGNADIADAATGVDATTKLDERSVSCGISVFRELGFLTTSGYGSARRIRMESSPAHMDLNASTRYLEGMRLREEFERFRDWALQAPAEEMLARVNRPIVPGFGRVVDGGR